ncbi:hypothetical protein HDU67_004394 [Dinochytrium kinnereticum]|nr:hypothetical protein HDU67_004394 [Dinochytrium kinnereticum]
MQIFNIIALVAAASSALALPSRIHKAHSLKNSANVVAAPVVAPAVVAPVVDPAVAAPVADPAAPEVVAPQVVAPQVVAPVVATVLPTDNQTPENIRAAQKANIDLDVLNFALTLEHLEAKFYEVGLTKFSDQDFFQAGFKPRVRQEFTTINNNEATHVDFLTDQINRAFGLNVAVPECEYDFSVALKDVQNFVSFAAILERTGVSAYDGANQLLTKDAFLTAAASIVTIEARHSAFLNLITRQNPAFGPFDTPLGIQPIVSLAAPLIKSCPFKLPASPLPPLQVVAFNDEVKLNGNIVVLFDVNQRVSPYRAGDINTKAVIGERSGEPALSGLDQFEGLLCNWVAGLQQFRTQIVAVSAVDNAGRQIMVPSCRVPNELREFTQVVLFTVNANKDVALVNPDNIVAGPATLNIRQ